MEAMVPTLVLSIWRCGKWCSRSLKVNKLNSFLSISALKGPTPFRYSMGLDKREAVLKLTIFKFCTNIPKRWQKMGS